MKIRTDKRGVCVLVCTHGSKKKKGCCRGRGSDEIRRALAKEVDRRGLRADVRIRKVGCLGCCSAGPALVTYPDAAICTRVRKKDVGSLVDRLAEMVPSARDRSAGYGADEDRAARATGSGETRSGETGSGETRSRKTGSGKTGSGETGSGGHGPLAAERDEQRSIVFEVRNVPQVRNSGDVDPSAELERLDEVVAEAESPNLVRTEHAPLPLEASKRLG